MNYRDHCDSCLNDGKGPFEDCCYCRRFIIEPAIRDKRNEYPELEGKGFVTIEGTQVVELAASWVA